MDDDGNWVEHLISAVKRRPILYDKTHSACLDRALKNEAWIEVCEAIVPGWGDMPEDYKLLRGKEIQQRWTNTRHCFLRELRAQKNSESGSGGRSAKKRRRYIYFDELLFLLPTVGEDRKPSSTTLNESSQYCKEEEEEAEIVTVTEFADSPRNVTGEPTQAFESDYGECEDPPSSPSPCPCPPIAPQTRRRRKRPRGPDDTADTDDDNDNKRNVYEQALLDILLRKKESENDIDEDKSFLLSFVPALKRMPVETKFEAKMEIMKLVHKYELQDRPPL